MPKFDPEKFIINYTVNSDLTEILVEEVIFYKDLLIN